MMSNMTIEEEWLGGILSVKTRLRYLRAIKFFKEFLGKNSIEELVEARKTSRNFENTVVLFYKWLQDKKELNANSSRSYCVALQSLYAFVQMPLRMKRKLPNFTMKIESFRLTLADLQKVYRLGGLDVKAWLSFARDCCARVSDQLRIMRDRIPSGQVLISEKEKVPGKFFLSEETQDLFKSLENARMELPSTESGVNKMLAKASEIAGLQGKIHTHLLRKFWISQAINTSGVPEIVTKILSFKAVDQSLLTYYLDREELHEYWKKVIDSMPLEPKTNGNGRISNIEEALDLVMKTLRRMIEKEMHSGTMGQERLSDLDVIRKYLES